MRNSDIRSIENLAFDSRDLDIRWRLTNLCNYQCDFCIQGNKEAHLRKAQGESRELREQICKKIIELIVRQKQYRRVKIGLIGGEVTILQDFPDILKALSCSPFRGELQFYITTNLSRDADYFCRLCDIIYKPAFERRLHISASFYKAYAPLGTFAGKLRETDAYVLQKMRRRSPVEILLRKQRERRVSLSAGIPMLNDAGYRDFLDMKDALEGSAAAVSPIVIRKYPADISDDIAAAVLKSGQKNIRVLDLKGKESSFQNIQALGMALEDRESFCPTGYRCDAGIHNIWIDALGNVKRCPAIGNTGWLGNILDGSFRMLDAPAVCASDHCSCNQFGHIEK